MIWLLLVSLLLILYISYLIFDKELCHPSVLMCAMLIVSVLCCVVNIEKWDVDLHSETVLLLVGMTALFVVVGVPCSRFEKNAIPHIADVPRNPIEVSQVTFWVLVLIDIACLVILYQGVSSIAASYGSYSSLGDMLNTYRSVASYGGDEKLSFLADKSRKLSDCIAYVFIFIFVYNLTVEKGSFRKWKHYLIPISLGFVASILNSGRLQILMLIAAAIFEWLFLRLWATGWKRANNGRTIIRLVFIFVGVLVAFYLIRLIVGRLSSESLDLVDYVTMYAGGSIQLLDMYLQNPAPKTGISGVETFYTLVANLNNYGIIHIGNMPIIHLEFRYNGLVQIGNVYTAYRRWIADFGILGAAVLQIILSLIFHSAYYKLKRSDKIPFSFGFLLFSYLVPTMMMQSIDSVFYRTVFSLSFLFVLLFLYATYRICIDTRHVEHDTKVDAGYRLRQRKRYGPWRRHGARN